MRWQLATVTRIIEQTPRIKSFFIALAEPFAYRAGQHVDVRLTAPDGYRAQRSYSIASAPDGTAVIELAIERLADGEVSPFFHDVVAVGDPIELRGPLGGYFFWPAEGTQPILLAGGGSGIVPLMSMLRHRHAVADRRPVALIYSTRTMSDAVFAAELIELASGDETFVLALTLTREQPARPGDYNRRVDGPMIAEVLARLPAVPSDAFVCGSNAFVNAAADGALHAGLPAAAIKTERYGV